MFPGSSSADDQWILLARHDLVRVPIGCGLPAVPITYSVLCTQLRTDERLAAHPHQPWIVVHCPDDMPGEFRGLSGLLETSKPGRVRSDDHFESFRQQGAHPDGNGGDVEF